MGRPGRYPRGLHEPRSVSLPVTLYDEAHGPVSPWPDAGHVRASVRSVDAIGVLEGNEEGLRQLAAYFFVTAEAGLDGSVSCFLGGDRRPLEDDSAGVGIARMDGSRLIPVGPPTVDADGAPAWLLTTEVPVIGTGLNALRLDAGTLDATASGGDLFLFGNADGLGRFGELVLAVSHPDVPVGAVARIELSDGLPVDVVRADI